MDANQKSKFDALGTWQSNARTYSDRAYSALYPVMREACDACPYRDAPGGCLSKSCPVFSVWNAWANSGKLRERTAKKIARKICDGK